MKKSFLILFFFGWALPGAISQSPVTFEDSSNLFRIVIDTTLPGNTWQIGPPQKALFDNAYSPPNAIVTGLADPYPVNNTSRFFLGTKGDNGWLDYHAANLWFWYRVDSDTLNDFGRVEISLDTGKTWHNILRSDWNYAYYTVRNLDGYVIKDSGSGDTLVFTGTTPGWYEFYSEFTMSESEFYDTLLYRFTFYSDNQPESRDGWIIDNINYYTVWEAVNDHASPCRLYPNPASGQVRLFSASPAEYLEIFNIPGVRILKVPLRTNSEFIDISTIQPGLYIYRVFFNDGKVGSGKLIKSANVTK